MRINNSSVPSEKTVTSEHQTVRQSILEEVYDESVSGVKSEMAGEIKPDLLANNSFAGKRSIDLFIGMFTLPFFLLLYPIVGLFIKLSSRSPVLYTQRRTGKGGHEFTCYKFRTMHQLDLRRIDGKPIITKEGDKRIFWFGKLLRRTSLDELPQVLNVLKGDMSLIGPRPYPIKECAYWNNIFDDFHYRYAVKPGISGLAQVNGYRGGTFDEEHMRRRLDYDLIYVEKNSLLLDLKILVETIGKMAYMNTKPH